MATGPNCVANVPIGHEYGITDYGDTDTDPFVSRFTSDGFALRRQVQTSKDEGTGSPWDIIGSAIETRNTVSGAVSLIPRPDQMATWLPCIFGNAPITSTTYGPGGGICDFYHIGHYDNIQDQIFRYNNCVTDTWRMTASDSSPLLKMEVNVEAGSRLLVDGVGGTAWPSLPLSILQPFVFCYATLKIGATFQRVKEITISGNNNLDKEGFFNSCNRVEIPSQSQMYELTCSVPFDGAAALALLNTSANVSAQAVFTSGIYTMTIDFPSLFTRPEDPSISGKQRILLPITFQAQYDPNTPGQTPILFTVTP